MASPGDYFAHPNYVVMATDLGQYYILWCSSGQKSDRGRLFGDTRKDLGTTRGGDGRWTSVDFSMEKVSIEMSPEDRISKFEPLKFYLREDGSKLVAYSNGALIVLWTLPHQDGFMEQPPGRTFVPAKDVTRKYFEVEIDFDREEVFA